MANVPRVTRRVFTDPLPGARMTAVETEASAGLNIAEAEMRKGAAMRGFGAELGEAARVFAVEAAKEKQRADEIALMEADNQLTAWTSQALYDPKTGVLNRRGKDALGAPEETLGEFSKRADAVANSLANREQKEAFLKLRLRHQATLDMTVRRHTYQEMQRYEATELDAFVTNAKNNAVANGEDPRRVNEEITRAVEAIKTHAPRLGLGPEAVQGQVDAVHSQVYGGVIQGLVNDGKMDAARAYWAEVGDQVKGDAHVQIEKAIKAGTIRQQSQDETEKILAQFPDDLDAQRKAAKNIENREVRDETVQRLEHEAGVRDRADADRRRQDMVDAKNVIDSTGDWRKVPVTVWERFTPAEAASLKAYAKKNGDVETDPQTYYRLVQQLTSDDPAERAKFFDVTKTNLLGYVDKLSPTDLQQFMELQTKGHAQMQAQARALLVNQASQNRMVDEALMSMGMDPTPPQEGAKDYDQAKVDRVVAFRRTVREAVGALEASQQKQATDQQVQAIVDQLRKPIGSRMVKDGWFKDDYAPVYKFEITDVNQIPKDTLEMIKGTLRRRGNPVTAPNIISLYLLYQGSAFSER